MKKKIFFRILVSSFVLFLVCGLGSAADLPVKSPEQDGFKEVPESPAMRKTRGIKNLYTVEQIYGAIKGGQEGGLLLDLTTHGQTRLLDGRTIDPQKIYGNVYMGPYPFEAGETQYSYKRFRRSEEIKAGKAFLDLGYFLVEGHNSEDWVDEGQVVVRLELRTNEEGMEPSLGAYDIFVGFRVENRRFEKLPALIEGPMVNMVRSDACDRVVISFKTGEPVESAVVLDNGKRFPGQKGLKKHEIEVSGLQPGKHYRYHVEIGKYRSTAYSFRTAPKPGAGTVVFAYSGDGREGTGGGYFNFMGVNYTTLERIANLVSREGAELFVFGGDLLNGNTASVEDFRTQMYAWKQALAGFWHHRPVYACMGNHESLLRVFKYLGGEFLRLDRWPYDTESAEAVFADELVHPQNGPRVSDPRRPSYKENVYSFQYGPVKFIAFNNNYWISKAWGAVWQVPTMYGGSPEGYIMKDQLDWIEGELLAAEKDPSIKYVILFAQEPVFPNGGHVQDCMWYNGSNHPRAFTYDAGSGEVIPEEKGILEVRNAFVRRVGNCRKVAAVLGCDEHSYHKVLIDNEVPVGDPLTDDSDGDGVVCVAGTSCSALKDLKYPTWYLVSGGAGAPYYSEQKTPWNLYWKKNPDRYRYKSHTSMRGCYYYSSQENVMIFKADSQRISVTVYNPYGEIIDKIDDLMIIKDPTAWEGESGSPCPD
jgi:hypothetical protein